MAARLLVVDDEAALLNLLRRYLERVGYEVDAFASPEEALKQYEKDPSRYQMVIADLTLDGMNGEEMMARMRQITPGLPGLLCSGMPYEPQLPGVGFLQKPYLPDMLASAVKRALNKRTRA